MCGNVGGGALESSLSTVGDDEFASHTRRSESAIEGHITMLAIGLD
jgi:hypothetical protein